MCYHYFLIKHFSGTCLIHEAWQNLLWSCTKGYRRKSLGKLHTSCEIFWGKKNEPSLWKWKAIGNQQIQVPASFLYLFCHISRNRPDCILFWNIEKSQLGFIFIYRNVFGENVTYLRRSNTTFEVSEGSNQSCQQIH